MAKKSVPSKNSSKLEGNTKREGEGSMYDKILRENLLQLFLPLVQEELNFELKAIHPLPDKQATTVLRETDAFLRIETHSEDEPEFILHIEFESGDDPEMIYRVMEHHGIELRKYRLPIKHVVVYLGEEKPKMRTKLRKEEIFEGFTLVRASSFSPQKWLEEEEPSRIIMAILGDYRKENATIILEAIINKLWRVCKSSADLKKFIKQLIVISRMRNLEKLTIKISEAMPITYNIYKDYLYNLGLEDGEKKLKAFKAKVEEERVRLEAKAAEAAKAAEEKARLEAKVKLEAQIRSANISTIKKMRAKGFPDDEIFELLSLEKEELTTYLKFIDDKVESNE